MESKGSTTLPGDPTGRLGWASKPEMAGHFFETWVFLGKWLFLDIDSIHQVAKYWFWHMLESYKNKHHSSQSLLEDWRKDMKQQTSTNIICIKPGCNPSKSQKGGVKRGGIIYPKQRGVFLDLLCLFQMLGNKKWQTGRWFQPIWKIFVKAGIFPK